MDWRRSVPPALMSLSLTLALVSVVYAGVAAPPMAAPAKPVPVAAPARPAEAPAAEPTLMKAQGPTPAPAAPASPIRLSVARTPGPASALLIIADDQGLLKKNGLEAEIRTFPSSADAVSALIAGEIVGAQPSAQIINSLIGRNVDIRVLGVVSRNPRDMKVVGTRDIGKPADLKGKKVAVVAGSASEFLITQYLAGGGLSIKDVDVVKADPPEVVAVVHRGEAQAFALWEPFPANALKLMGDKGKILAYSEDLGYRGTLFQIMSTKFLRERPDAAVRLMRAYAEAEQFLKANAEKSLGIIAKAARLEVGAAKPLVEAGDFRLVADQDMLDELKKLGQWMHEIRQLKEVPDHSKVIDVSFLQKADPSRVTLKP